ncbi:MAG: bi-domain-containing oxidoreductase, partial [Planctomycetes bacterium]|nr:bi-domain-containing oxidoreductase [Planctomycetota bacterium]
MKQVVQDYKSGELRLEDVPVPICKPGGVVVRAAYSLVSSGTERMKVSQARMNLVQMAKARPDKVRQVLTSMRQIGLKETVNKVRERLETLTPLGYSLAGTVVEVGAGVDEFAVGDRVACAGEGIACHAEFVFVPRNLCAAVPKNVAMEDAAFTTVGAIALNGVRQAEVSIGDSVLVVGLGLVGLLAVQLLKAAGCRVLGVDVDAEKVSLAKECGAMAAFARDDDALEDSIRRLTDGLGVDCVYLAASTRHADPMELAGKVTRDRGRIVVVGKVPLEGDWQTYYGKELSIVMSRSYGPGRYDRNYEQKGIDYPVGYVRWTEQRNMGAFLQLMAEGRVSPGRLGPESFDITDAPEAYKQLHTATAKHATGILFRYPQDAPLERRVEVGSPREFLPSKTGAVGVGVVGAGNFVTATLIPVLKRIPGVNLRAICSAGGLSAKSASQRHGFERAVTEFQDLLDDDRIESIVIGTRHDTHARFAAEALRAGKHVFVEKPLALTREQLDTVLEAHRESGKILMPGFNRRFSPLSIAVRDFFSNRAGPIEVICRVNAGELRADSGY